jgi:hypothetical protein
MKNVIPLLILAAICYSFQTGISVTKPKPKVRMAIHLRNNDTAEYFYNAVGQIQHIRNSNGDSSNYQYLKDIIIKKNLMKPCGTGLLVIL